MEKLVAKLTKLLEEKLPDSQFFPDVTPGKRVTGTILWDEFQGKDQVERQQIVRSFIRERFTKAEQSKISLIVTFTPHEYKIIQRESA